MISGKINKKFFISSSSFAKHKDIQSFKLAKKKLVRSSLKNRFNYCDITSLYFMMPNNKKFKYIFGISGILYVTVYDIFIT